MHTLFLICAAFGGTFLVLQAIMTFIGLGGDALHTDLGADAGHDLGGEVHGDVGSGMETDAQVPADAAHDLHHHPAKAVIDHGSSKLFAILSLRGIVAAMAFFGMGGLIALAADQSDATALVIAAACGATAMYAVYWVMQALASLQAEGTVRLSRAVGQPATVYLRIPGHRSGAGKIQINLQNRTMEYEAVTPGDTIPTGARVVVVGVVNSETVEVRPLASDEGVCDA